MSRVAVTYSPIVGGSSVVSLKESFKTVGSDVVDADYREMMAEIPKEEFDKLYATAEGRLILFAHAKAKAFEVLKDVDCLALSGNSAMIDPELFDQQREKGQNYDFSRTIAELALVHIATERGMPILGICGGHQVIAVHGGGTIADLKAEQLDKQHLMNYDVVKLNKESMLAKIIGATQLRESDELHHYEGEFFGAHSQVVSKLGKGFKQTAIASDGESIEAAESEFGAPIITTQFHPEVGAKGLPNATFLYKRTEAEAQMNLALFRALDCAGNAFSHKKTVMDELKQYTPTDDTLIKPSDIKAAQKLAANGVNKTPPKQHSTSWFGRVIASIASFFVAIAEAIKGVFSTLLRNAVSTTLTKDLVGKLRKKEKQSSEIPDKEEEANTSSFSKILPGLSPADALRETHAKLWTKQDDEQIANQVGPDLPEVEDATDTLEHEQVGRSRSNSTAV